uniref:Uncharacterized protein n=1 Tax=Timema poppense TaxID=170557 RepID=A0A7R9CZE4_TIMPO|nr:unnamed protein product [Timema poppensis]
MAFNRGKHLVKLAIEQLCNNNDNASISKQVCSSSEYSLEHTNRRSQKETNKENIVSLKQSESVLVDQIEQETPEGSSCQSLEPSILVVLDDVLGLNDLTSDHECGEKPCIDLDLKIVTQCASSTQVINVNEPNDYVDDGEEEEENDDDDDELKDPIYAPNIDDDLYSDSLPSSQDGTPVKRRKTSKVSLKSFYKLQNIPLLDLMPVSTNTELKPTNKRSVPIEESFETNEIVFDTDDIVSRRERRGFCISNLTLSQAYHEPLKIKKEKLSDLLELCSSGAIREQYHHFYGLLQGTEEIDRDLENLLIGITAVYGQLRSLLYSHHSHRRFCKTPAVQISPLLYKLSLAKVTAKRTDENGLLVSINRLSQSYGQATATPLPINQSPKRVYLDCKLQRELRMFAYCLVVNNLQIPSTSTSYVSENVSSLKGDFWDELLPLADVTPASGSLAGVRAQSPGSETVVMDVTTPDGVPALGGQTDTATVIPLDRGTAALTPPTPPAYSRKNTCMFVTVLTLTCVIVELEVGNGGTVLPPPPLTTSPPHHTTGAQAAARETGAVEPTTAGPSSAHQPGISCPDHGVSADDHVGLPLNSTDSTLRPVYVSFRRENQLDT